MDTHIIITQRGPILVYAKMPLAIGPSSATEPSLHAISSAACTTNIVGYSFRKGQDIGVPYPPKIGDFDATDLQMPLPIIQATYEGSYTCQLQPAIIEREFKSGDQCTHARCTLRSNRAYLLDFLPEQSVGVFPDS
jgi:hypothetical protein